MIKTTTISDLRINISKHINSLDNEPLLVLNHGKQAAYVVNTNVFEALIERIEFLEDLLAGRQALAEIQENPDMLVDAEDAFLEMGF